MTRMRHALAACLVAASAFVQAARAHACSCVEEGGVKESLDQAGSVFEGKVETLRHDPARHRITARVAVLRRWKGADAKSVDVVTIDEGSLCGFGFERGKSYLLFTPETGGTLSTGLCSRSKASELAAADFAALDRLSLPDAGAPPPTASVQPAPAVVPATPPPVHSAPSELAKAAPEPRHGGCAGCASTGGSRPISGVPMLLALALGASVLRRRATAPATRA